MEVGPAWEKEILDKSFIRWEIEKSEQLVKCESFFGEFEINFEVTTVFLLLKRYFELKIKQMGYMKWYKNRVNKGFFKDIEHKSELILNQNGESLIVVQ